MTQTYPLRSCRPTPLFLSLQGSRIPTDRGFTLIELLVVVSIIVALLALLAPTMEKAIYQAELTVCGARQRTIADGASIYALGNQRAYPYRPAMHDDVIWQPVTIYNGSAAIQAFYNAGYGGTSMTVYDDRPILRTMFPLNHLNDPLTGKLDFDSIDSTSTAQSSYSLWFGWQYTGQHGMKRLGDRWTWSGTDPGNNSQVNWRFDVLASEHDSIGPPITTAVTNHPDHDYSFTNVVMQNQPYPGVAAFIFVSSYWTGGDGDRDLNYAFADGAVQRFTKVRCIDPSMAHIPEINRGPNGLWVTMPPQR